jgi:hypothetical protein
MMGNQNGTNTWRLCPCSDEMGRNIHSGTECGLPGNTSPRDSGNTIIRPEDKSDFMGKDVQNLAVISNHTKEGDVQISNHH